MDIFNYYYREHTLLKDTYNIGDLEGEQYTQLHSFLKENSMIFAWEETKLGRTALIKHHINTGNTLPIKHNPYQHSPAIKEIIKTELTKMLKEGFIQPCHSPWTSPVVLVPKRDRETQFCIDYCKLNSVTQKDNYPIPRIQNLLDTLSGSSWYSSLNLASGYWQVEVEDSNELKTAFTTPYGVFMFHIMPFGLTNAPATF